MIFTEQLFVSKCGVLRSYVLYQTGGAITGRAYKREGGGGGLQQLIYCRGPQGRTYVAASILLN